QVVLIAARASPAPRDPRRLRECCFDVGEDRALRARGDERLAQAVDVHVGAPAVPPIPGLDRHERIDAVGAHELAVAERDHPGLALGHQADVPSSTPRASWSWSRTRAEEVPPSETFDSSQDPLASTS